MKDLELPEGALYLPSPGRCASCGFPTSHCCCALIPRVACRTNIVIVRHTSERHKTTNTGGLAGVVIGATRIDHGRPGRPLDLTGTLGERPRLLLPHGSEKLGEPPSTLVVLDGSWQQIRSMRSRIKPLSHVPLLSLPDAPSRMRMRRAPRHLQGFSTMEAIAEALEVLGEPEPAAALRDLYDELVRRWVSLGLGCG